MPRPHTHTHTNESHVLKKFVIAQKFYNITDNNSYKIDRTEQVQSFFTEYGNSRTTFTWHL